MPCAANPTLRSREQLSFLFAFITCKGLLAVQNECTIQGLYAVADRGDFEMMTRRFTVRL
jgi:hypothetical protein